MSANVLDRRGSQDLMEAFVNHYYPAQAESPAPQPPADFQDRASRFTGAYRINIYAHLTLEKMSQLGKDVRVTADGDGTLSVHLPGQTTQWVEVEPSLFQRLHGSDYLAFREDENGRITHMFIGATPYAAYERLAWYENSVVHLGLFGFAMLFFLSAILAGPASYLVRRIQRKPSAQTEQPPRTARWLAIVVSALYLVFFVGRVLLSAQAIYGLPPMLQLVFVLPIMAVVLTIGLVAFTILAWRDKYWGIWERLHYTLITLAALTFVWWLNYWNLVGFRF